MQCLPDHYEKEDGCEPVTKLVENCSYYEDEGICSVCAQGYFQVQGSCILIQA